MVRITVPLPGIRHPFIKIERVVSISWGGGYSYCTVAAREGINQSRSCRFPFRELDRTVFLATARLFGIFEPLFDVCIRYRRIDIPTV